ncbi:DMT family transporter [Flavobacteriaceae bacterium M23B6Z8]
MDIKYSQINLVIAALIWSTSSTIVVKFQHIANPSFCALIIVISSTIFFTLYISLFKREVFKSIIKCKPKDLGRFFLYAILGIFAYPILYFTGLHSEKPIEANIINYTWPLIALISGFTLNREKFQFKKLVGVIMGFLGMILVITDFSKFTNSLIKEDFFSENFLPYYFTAFLGALLYGIYTSLINRSTAKLSNTPSVDSIAKFYIMLLSACLVHILVLVINSGREDVFEFNYSDSAFIYLLVYSIFNFGLAYFLWFSGASRVNISLASALAFIIPIASSLFLIIFNDLEFSVQIIYALILLSLGIYLSQNNDIFIIPLVGAIISAIIFSLIILAQPFQESSKEISFQITAIVGIFSFYAGHILNKQIKKIKKENDILMEVENIFLELIIRNKSKDKVGTILDQYYCKMINWYYLYNNNNFISDTCELEKIYDVFQTYSINFPLEKLIERNEKINELRKSKVGIDEWFILLLLVFTLVLSLLSQQYSTLIEQFSILAICVGAISLIFSIFDKEKRTPLFRFSNIMKHQRIQNYLGLPPFIPEGIPILNNHITSQHPSGNLIYRSNPNNLNKTKSSIVRRNYFIPSLYLILLFIFILMFFVLKMR